MSAPIWRIRCFYRTRQLQWVHQYEASDAFIELGNFNECTNLKYQMLLSNYATLMSAPIWSIKSGEIFWFWKYHATLTLSRQLVDCHWVCALPITMVTVGCAAFYVVLLSGGSLTFVAFSTPPTWHVAMLLPVCLFVWINPAFLSQRDLTWLTAGPRHTATESTSGGHLNSWSSIN